MHYDELRAPWRSVPDPDGPTTILNCDGRLVGDVEPRLADAIAALPEALRLLGPLAAQGCRCSDADLVLFDDTCRPCEARRLFQQMGMG